MYACNNDQEKEVTNLKYSRRQRHVGGFEEREVLQLSHNLKNN